MRYAPTVRLMLLLGCIDSSTHCRLAARRRTAVTGHRAGSRILGTALQCSPSRRRRRGRRTGLCMAAAYDIADTQDWQAGHARVREHPCARDTPYAGIGRWQAAEGAGVGVGFAVGLGVGVGMGVGLLVGLGTGVGVGLGMGVGVGDFAAAVATHW